MGWCICFIHCPPMKKMVRTKQIWSNAMTEETALNSSKTKITEEGKAKTFTLSPKDGICSHATCFSTRAALCVGHFGSAVTILDKRCCNVVELKWLKMFCQQAADGMVYIMDRLVEGEGRSQHVYRHSRCNHTTFQSGTDHHRANSFP